MDFSKALEAMKAGKRVQNKNWNGNGMCIFMMPGYPDGVPANAATAKAAGIPEGENITVKPYIMMRDASGSYVPWMASQQDIFSEAWEMVE